MTRRDLALPLTATLNGLVLLFLATFPLVLAAALSPQPTTSGLKKTSPSPGLEPSEVVRIQVEALRSNNYLNEGIELTYLFASPDNQRVTGPLPRFVEMVRSAPYDRLLNHRSARYGPLSVAGDEAYQIVIVTDKLGEEAAYLWVLSRQSEGEFKDCWMTDAVVPAEQPVQRELAQTSAPGKGGFTRRLTGNRTPCPAGFANRITCLPNIGASLADTIIPSGSTMSLEDW